MLSAYARVARLEYLPAMILLMLIPTFMAENILATVVNPNFYQGIAVFFILYITGFMTNALADVEVDKKYSSYKKQVHEATGRIGIPRLKILILTHVAIAILLTGSIFLGTGEILVPILAGMGIFLGLGYSLRPFSFKIRGPSHGISLALSAFFIPLAFLMVIINGTLTFINLVLLTGFTLAMYSLEFANQAMDYYEDKEENLETPSVKYSLKSTLRFALLILLVGLVLSITGLVSITIGKLKNIHTTLVNEVAIGLVCIIVLLGFLKPARGMHRLYQTSAIGHNVFKKALKHVEHARWQASGALGVTIVCGLLLISSISGTILQINPATPVINKRPEVTILNNNNTIVNAGDLVTFKGMVTDDGPVSIEWLFGDGTGASGVNVNHTYSEIGIYKVILRATDGQLEKGYHSIIVIVTDLYISGLAYEMIKALGKRWVTFDINITNDKNWKDPQDLMVTIQYDYGTTYVKEYLDTRLKPANIWGISKTIECYVWDENPRFLIGLHYNNGGSTYIVQEEYIVVK
jgi:4-hydroxybenzoate polyprenyltransferase